MTEDEKRARVRALQLESWKKLQESYSKGPERVRAALREELIPRYQHRREEWEARLEELAPRVENMTVEEAGACLYPRQAPDWWTAWTKFRNEVSLACSPYLRKDELVDGAVYRISCRNSNCGVWREKEEGFEIPRYKFGRSFLFVEYHWDNGPPYGTSKPWERLADLPKEVLEDDPARLQYLVQVEEEVRRTEGIRLHLGLSSWAPLPDEGSDEWVRGAKKYDEGLALQKVRMEEWAKQNA